MDKNDASSAISGGILIFSALMALLFMTHHPTIGDPGYGAISDELAAERGLNAFVHGAMIVITLAYYFAMAQLAQLQGSTRASVSAGKLAFATATAMMIGAALASGFIVPGVAERLAGNEEILRAQITFAGTVNQVLAKGGSAFYGAGIFLLSLALFAYSGINKLIALIGLVIGAGITVAVVSDLVSLNVTGMTAIVAIMGIWFIAVGVQMIRRKI